MSHISLCARLLQALGDRAPKVTAEDVAKSLDGWDLLDVNGAVVMLKGREVHVAALPQHRGKWITRKDLKRVLGALIKQYGMAETFVMRDNAAGNLFVQRLGFEKVGESGAAIRYELRKLRHA